VGLLGLPAGADRSSPRRRGGRQRPQWRPGAGRAGRGPVHRL